MKKPIMIRALTIVAATTLFSLMHSGARANEETRAPLPSKYPSHLKSRDTGSLQAHANAVKMRGAQQATSRPASVPKEYVPTPFGYVAPSCYIKILNSEYVKNSMIYSRGDTPPKQIYACQYPQFTRDGEKMTPSSALFSPDSGNDDLLALVQTSSKEALGLTTAFFTGALPALSLSPEQTVYLTNGSTGDPSFQQGGTGLYSVLGWNMPYHPGAWATAIMLSNINNNVIVKSETNLNNNAFTALDVMESINNPPLPPPPANEYNGSIGAFGYGGKYTLEYNEGRLLRKVLMLSMQLFGAPSCESLAPLNMGLETHIYTSAFSQTKSSPSRTVTDPNVYINPDSSCKINFTYKINTPDTYLNASIKFGDIPPPPQGRSAILTYKNN